jgi:outer membrane protein assembly factor BamB
MALKIDWETLMKFNKMFYLTFLLLNLACSPPEPTLPGVREMLDGSAVIKAEDWYKIDNLPKLKLPEPSSNSKWTHRGGNAQHNPGHVSLAGSLKLKWQSSIGRGNSRRHQIASGPVAEEGQIFTLDSQSLVTALDVNGVILWQRDVSSEFEEQVDASGGGLALAKGQLFVTTGFGTVQALNAKTGEVLWLQDLESYGGASPTIYENLLYLSARDGSAWAIETDTGRVKWQVSGPSARSGFVGGPGAAVNDKYALFPFGSGDIFAVFRKGGLPSWNSVLSGARMGRSLGSVQDLTGQPVIDLNTIYLSNSAGRMAALDLETGKRKWTSNEGSNGDILVLGESIFFVTDENRLARLSKLDGSLIWSVQLPHFTKKNTKRRAEIFAHYGPILAGGRLVLVSSDQLLREFDPLNGSLISSIELPSAAASNPIVVNETLYTLTVEGDLLAFR